MVSNNRYRFFRQHAGGTVGRNAETAYHLARAEEYAADRGWRFDWEPDQDPDLSWCACADGKVSHSHEVLICTLRDSAGKVLASLGGIVDADRNYGRVIEAELASEALSTGPRRCSIQWIDLKTGEPTPDDNVAVALIQCVPHQPSASERWPVSSRPSSIYPCCAEHLSRMPKIGRCGSAWAIVDTLIAD